MEQSKNAIRKTLIYSDIFDYPLSFDQLYQFLIAEERISKKLLLQQVQHIRGIEKKDFFFVLAGRGELVIKRKEKQHYSSIKLQKARNIAYLLSYIPTVFFIGVSGGVAMQNAEKDDDIDFFIITKKGTVWITRLLVTSCLAGMGMLRMRGTKNVSDKMCVNLLLDETALAFEKDRQDLYTAHEIVQVYPLVQRHNMYRIFREKNNWTKKFLPHATHVLKNIPSAEYIPFLHAIFEILLSNRLIERLAEVIQKKRMQRYITKEVISKSFLAFHPYDYRRKTLTIYNRRIANEKI